LSLETTASSRDLTLTYNQSGFELKNMSDQTILSLSKLGEMPIHLHLDIPDDTCVNGAFNIAQRGD